ncbi:uncharacterized protein [Macrobrachium rosenbergii]|uniref:uncharacterized protein n=1 Tax=Macrobrachium rosenbergii TaxID=79674 RepID=UPI0034D77E76
MGGGGGRGRGRGDIANRRREEECTEREPGNSPEDKERPAIISELFKDATQRGQSSYVGPLTGAGDQKYKEEIREDLICPQDGGPVHMGVAPLSPSSSGPNSGRSRGTITSDCTGGHENLGLCKSLASQKEVHSRKTENITTAANGVHKNTLVLNASAESANIGTTPAFRFIDDPLSDESNVSVDQIY